MLRRHRDGHGVNGQRTDRVVGAVVVAGFVNRQRLKNAHPMAGAPFHHLPDARGVAHPEVLPGANGGHRLKYPGAKLFQIY